MIVCELTKWVLLLWRLLTVEFVGIHIQFFDLRLSSLLMTVSWLLDFLKCFNKKNFMSLLWRILGSLHGKFGPCRRRTGGFKPWWNDARVLPGEGLALQNCYPSSEPHISSQGKAQMFLRSSSIIKIWCKFRVNFTMMVLIQSEDEREMCSRTIYCTNIDKKVNAE